MVVIHRMKRPFAAMNSLAGFPNPASKRIHVSWTDVSDSPVPEEFPEGRYMCAVHSCRARNMRQRILFKEPIRCVSEPNLVIVIRISFSQADCIRSLESLRFFGFGMVRKTLLPELRPAHL